MEEQQIPEEELYEHYKFTADVGQEPLRIDKFLTDRIPQTSRNKLQQAAQAGCILVNEKAVKANYKVRPNDSISVVMAYPKRELELVPEDLPLDIIHEDDHLLLVNKPAGMVVHPGFGNHNGTLVNALLFHFGHLPGIAVKEETHDQFDVRTPRPGLVHRIDKNTSGLLVIAKTEHALNHLAKQFFDRTTKRRYSALVWGDLKEDEGTITGHIGRSHKNRKVMDVFPEGEHGKHAVTHWTVLERFGYVTLVECRLETGRTHQIRAHFKHIGHPLFNDEEYGGNRILKGTTFTKYKQFVQNCFVALPRHALHARSLGFEHPATGEDMHFEVPLPPDMEEVLEKWRNYALHKKD